MSKVAIQKVTKEEDRALPIFSEFEKLADRIRVEAYNLFSHRGADEGRALDDWLEAERTLCWPAAELDESDGAYVVKVALAGYEPDEVSVTATPREILVKAGHEQRASGSDETEKSRWSEFRSNDTMRRVVLPEDVKVGEVSAKMKNGLLEISAPKADSGTAAKEVSISVPS